MRWKTKNSRWGIYTPRMHSIVRGTGTPKDRDEVNKRGVSECHGWVCDLDATGAPSIFKIIRNATVLARMLPTFDSDFRFVYYESLKRELKKRLILECRCDLGEHRRYWKLCCLLWIVKASAKDKNYIWISVRWKAKNLRWGIYTPRMHSIVRGTGTIDCIQMRTEARLQFFFVFGKAPWNPRRMHTC